MNKHLAIIVILACTTSTASAKEECSFDQAEQYKEYMELQQKYTGSRYVEKESKLIIPKNGHEITLKRGGCVHFGITIELKTPRTDQYEDEDKFFATIVDLVSEYGRELMDPQLLRMQINNRKWQQIDVKEGGFYFLEYAGLTAVEIYRNHEGPYTVLGISYYI